MRTVIALAAVLLATASTAAFAAPLPPAPANGAIELAREAGEGARREDRRQDRRLDRRQDRRQTELQAPVAEAGAVLVRERITGGGRHRHNHGVRGA